MNKTILPQTEIVKLHICSDGTFIFYNRWDNDQLTHDARRIEHDRARQIIEINEADERAETSRRGEVMKPGAWWSWMATVRV